MQIPVPAFTVSESLESPVSHMGHAYVVDLDTSDYGASADPATTFGETTAPTDQLLQGRTDAQQYSFLRLWDRIPPHLRKIHFVLHGPSWRVEIIDELADALSQYPGFLLP